MYLIKWSIMNKKISIIALFIFIVVAQILIIKNGKMKLTEDEIQWLKDQGPIIYAANENAPPLRFVDEVDNQYKGVVVDFVNQLSLELGVDIQTVPMQWDDALESLKEGETHLCDMFINKERSQNYLFTDPIYNLRTVLLTNTDNNFNFKRINKMKVATELGDYANNYLKENYPGAELVYTSNVEEGVELFVNGQVDAVIGDEPIIAYLLVERNENLNPEYSNIILYQQEVVFGVTKDKPELVPIFNKAIEQIKNKGQLEKIQQKWFGISTPLMEDATAEIIRNIAIISVIAAGVFIFIVFNNLSLQSQVKKRTKELENSRNELQIIFDGISDFMLVVDKNKKVLKINKSFADYFKITRNDMPETKCSYYLEKFCNDCRNCYVDEVYSTNEKVNKEVMVGRDVYEMNIQPLKDVNETLLISIKNITLDKINRNKMLQTNKMIAVGQLAAGMAHEIRNPLGIIIRTQSYLIRINEKIDESITKSLDFIDTAVKRSSKIIDNILSFSRLSSTDNKSININQMVQRLIEMHNDKIYSNRITVKIENNVNEDILLSPESMEHIILNLISNSLDAVDAGGELTIKTNVVDNDFILICEDNGCGIDENDINNIFNPFFTTKELGKGTGLGLFIVYSEVEKLNGKIDVKSKKGETIFTITIPLERKSESDDRIV